MDKINQYKYNIHSRLVAVGVNGGRRRLNQMEVSPRPLTWTALRPWWGRTTGNWKQEARPRSRSLPAWRTGSRCVPLKRKTKQPFFMTPSEPELDLHTAPAPLLFHHLILSVTLAFVFLSSLSLMWADGNCQHVLICGTTELLLNTCEPTLCLQLHYMCRFCPFVFALFSTW